MKLIYILYIILKNIFESMEKSEFTDHAGMCSDGEILASLDKSRGGKLLPAICITKQIY
jgi:hypothetical protein